MYLPQSVEKFGKIQYNSAPLFNVQYFIACSSFITLLQCFIDHKLLKLSHERMLSGRLFRRSGAATAKALDPKDFILKVTGFRRSELNDQRVRGS